MIQILIKRIVFLLIVFFAFTLSSPSSFITQASYEPKRMLLFDRLPISISFTISKDARMHDFEVWENAIKSAFSTWEEITKDIIKFEYAGECDHKYSDLTEKQVMYGNNENSVYVDYSLPPIFTPQTKKPMPVRTQYYGFNHIEKDIFFICEADIIFNCNYTWGDIKDSSSSNEEVFDIWNACSHEVGHVIGLKNHPEFPECTMNPELFPGDIEKRDLSDKDLELFRRNYSGFLNNK